MPFGGLLTTGIASTFGGLAGLFGGGKQQQTNTNGTIKNNGTSTFGQSTNPNLNPLQTALMNQFTKGASNLYNQSTNLTPYTSAGLENINNTSNLAAKNIASNLAARGLSWSPAAGTAETQNVLSRASQQNQFLNSIPLLQRQLQEGSLGDLMNAFKTIPVGQTSSGTTTQDNTQTQQGTNLVSGNPMAGLFSGAGAGMMAGMLPYLYNNMGGNNSSPSLSMMFDPNSSYLPGNDLSNLG